MIHFIKNWNKFLAGVTKLIPFIFIVYALMLTSPVSSYAQEKSLTLPRKWMENALLVNDSLQDFKQRVIRRDSTINCQNQLLTNAKLIETSFRRELIECDQQVLAYRKGMEGTELKVIKLSKENKRLKRRFNTVKGAALVSVCIVVVLIL